MLDELLGSGSEFDRASAVLGIALKGRCPGCRPLTRAELESYPLRRFVVGWAHSRTISGTDYEFRVLLDSDFPRSRIRVAVQGDLYLHWPHVEEHGVLCLPTLLAPLANPEGVLARTLDDAETLVARCAADPAFVEQELSREFLSYWHRSVKDKNAPVRSLLNVNERATRRIAVWRGKNINLVADSKSAVERWSQNFGYEVKPTNSGYFCFLDRPFIPPFPATGSEFLALLEARCPEVVELFKNARVSLDQTIVFVLAAAVSSGVGLIAVSLKLASLNGYRKDAALSAEHKLLIWKRSGRIEALNVERVDPAWIHGRGVNADLEKLHAAKIAVLGCGSIGSQVAVRLAQLGIGSLVLVDSEALEPANIGRHALGASSIDNAKAKELEKQIRRRFPHMQEVLGISKRWQSLESFELEKLKGADLIVSCMGDWPAEGVLNEWHHQLAGEPPVIYGWLDENGTAAHALCARGRGPCLACVLDADGALRVPETDWDEGGRLQTEPACGTTYQPYGPTDVLQAEALICNLVVDVLTGRSTRPEHRIYATCTARVKELGGRWSKAHMETRPAGFDGPFEFSRPVEPQRDCPLCGGVS